MTLSAGVMPNLHRLSHIVLNLIEFLVFQFLDLFRPLWKRIFTYLLSNSGIEINGSNPCDLKVYDERIYTKLLSSGMNAAFEGYVNKWFHIEDLEAFFETKGVNLSISLFFGFYHPYNICMGIINRLFDVQTVENSWKDGGEQYDYGLDLYKATTGPLLLFSCVRFKGNCNLAEAEQNQIEHLAKLLKLKPGMTILDVGCGFGAVAEYLARNFDVSVTGISVSEDTVKFASERCKGLNAKFLVKDYREIEGKYDRVICIEMSEHVGAHKYKAFLKKCHSLLKDDGLFCLQVVSNNQWYMYEYCGIFEKFLGLRVTFPQLKRVINDSFGLFVVEYIENIGFDYGRTWQEWYRKFVKNWPSISHLYDERFFRKWSLYMLAGSIAFRKRKMHVNIITFSKDGLEGGYRVNRE